jgi:exosortase/archaeosortase family protein
VLANLRKSLRELATTQPALVRFAVVGVAGYVTWYALYSYVLRPATQLDEWVIHSMVRSTEWFMRAIGWEVLPTFEQGLRCNVGVAGTGGVHIGDPCDGVVLFALFSIFLLAFPGPARHKVWFIPAGVAALHLVNIARVIALLFVQYYAPDWLQFNHDYTFTVLVYAIVFALWYLWARAFVIAPRHGN